MFPPQNLFLYSNLEFHDLFKLPVNPIMVLKCLKYIRNGIFKHESFVPFLMKTLITHLHYRYSGLSLNIKTTGAQRGNFNNTELNYLNGKSDTNFATYNSKLTCKFSLSPVSS